MTLRSLPSSPFTAFLAGASAILSFAPFGLWPIQIASLALLFHMVLHATTVKRAALLGWAYGFGWTLFGVYWLFITMHHYGHIPAWLSALAVVLMASCVLGPFFALGMASATWLRRRWNASSSVSALLILPVAWAISEWLRGWILTGLPWVASGYAHSASPLAGYAPLVGVYGIGLLAALAAGCFALVPARKRYLLLAACIFIVGLGLKSVAWTHPNGQPISVRLLQGNVSQETKFEESRIGNSLRLYEEMLMAAPADLIATPETALPLFIHQLPESYLTRLKQFAAQTNSHFAIGMLSSDEPRQYQNSVIGIAPSASMLYRYSKHHLVPFGEYMPWGFRWFVELMQIPLADQTPGPAQQGPFAVGQQWVLPNVCYEDLFGGEIAAQIAAAHAAGAPEASVLLNMSNLAWFDDSTALPQHLQISQMRALETGRPMLRATNTGATAVINPDGKVVAQLPFLTEGTLAASVQGYAGMTPYILCGNGAMVALCLLMLLAAWILARRKNAETAVAVDTAAPI